MKEMVCMSLKNRIKGEYYRQMALKNIKRAKKHLNDENDVLFRCYSLLSISYLQKSIQIKLESMGS